MGGGGGGFLAGFTSGIGQGARELNQNYMDMQLAKYKNAGKIWDSLANDNTYHPNIRQQFAQKALQLNSVNLFDKNSRAAADQVLKENPHDSVQQAIDAMQMTGQHMPSYYGQSGTVNPIQLEKEKKTADYESELEFMKKRGQVLSQSLQSSGAGGTDLDRDRMTLEGQRLMLGSAIPLATEHMIPYAEWTSKNGRKGTSPATFLHGKWYNPAGEEVSVTSQLPPQMLPSQSADGSMTYVGVNKKAGPTGVAAPPRILGSNTVSQVDPATLQTTSTTQRSLTPIQGAGSQPGPRMAPGQPQSAPQGSPAQGVPPVASGPPSMAPAGGGAPAPAMVKESYSVGPMEREKAAWTGMAQSHRIANLISQHPLVGPILGRAVELGNHIGSGWLIAKANKMLGNKDATAPIDDQIEQSVSKAATEAGADQETAQAAAEIITAMRAMNAAEVAMLSGGGGRGITRMYEMLRPALMNPTQDLSLIHGHMKSIDYLFADNLRSIYRNRYGSVKPPLAPDQMQYAQELGVLDRIYGNPGNDRVTAPPNSRKYKYYMKNPTTKQRIGSDDNNNWFDVATGQPVH